MKLLTSILTIASCGMMVSCYPVYPAPNGNGNKPAPTQKETVKEVTSEQDRQLAASQARLEEDARLRAERERKEALELSPEIDKPDIKEVVKDKPVVPKDLKFGAPVPNKPGFVFNPYTHNQVDARGVPSGTKIRDPNDPDPSHVFRVP